MRRFLRTGLLAWLLMAPSAFAIQQRQLEIVTPRGGSRGTTVEVLLQGMDLANPREILFYRPGIVAEGFEALPPLRHPHGLNHRGQAAEQVRVRFRIASDCPLGEHPFRLRTDTTLTTLATFWVGPFPTISEGERSQGENDSPDRAQSIPLNSTIAGTIHEGGKLDRDLYRVDLKAGQRLGVEVDSMRLCMMGYGGSEYDLMAFVLDANGRELARNDDNGLHVQDPLISFLAPTDGAYLVEVRQRIFRNHHWGSYRLHVGDFVRPLAVYPSGGKLGESLTVRLLGDASGEETQVVAIPEKPGSFDFFPGLEGHQPPSSLTMRSSTYGNVLEAETGGETPAPGLPIALNGLIESPGDSDTFRLPCKKGTSYRIRAFAGSLGSLLDPKIRLRAVDSPSGSIEREADDSRLTDRDLFGLSNELQPRDLLDPSFLFTPERDGDYLLEIGDTRGMGGPTFVYRIEVEPSLNSVYTYVASTANDAFEANRVTGFIVPRGNRWAINVLLGEGQGNRYKGDLDLVAFGLPPGVEMIAPRIPSGSRMVPVQFVASESAKEGSALIEILARPTATDVPLISGSRQGFSFVNQSGGHAFHHVSVDRFGLGVTQPAPFHIELVAPQVALSRGGELSLTVKLVRHEGFDEAVDFQADWLPPGLAGESAVTISPGQTEAKFAIHADTRARPGRFRIAMNATTTSGFVYTGVGRTRVSSSFVDLTVSEPYLTINMPRSAIERGGRSEIACEINHLKPFRGLVTASLKRLPNGVSLAGPLVKISGQDNQVRFPIEATDDALVGLYPGILCEVTVEENGQTIRQAAGTGVLRVDPRRGSIDAKR
jgi:Bacterial pre-peptidase C-terminal domain